MTARRLAFAAITLLGVPCSDAQNVAPGPQPIPAIEIIRKFGRPEPDKSTEPAPVPAAEPATPVPPVEPAQPDSAKPDVPSEPGTGQPPSETDPGLEPPNPNPDDSRTPPAAATPTPRPGLAVRVEKLQAGTGTIDPSQVKLRFPFPAKPLSQPPAGWSLKSSPTAPPFTREIELSPGRKITLSIRPDLLVPDADGANVFSMPEPGFDASLGYRQNATIGTILSSSIRQLDQDSIELGSAIDKLQQILVSLPKPEPKAEPVPEPQPPPKPGPKTKPPTTRKR